MTKNHVASVTKLSDQQNIYNVPSVIEVYRYGIDHFFVLISAVGSVPFSDLPCFVFTVLILQNSHNNADTYSDNLDSIFVQ